MKKINLILGLALVALTISCGGGKKSRAEISAQNDSLSVIISQRDSVINDIFNSMNSIAENLNSIKLRENIITGNIAGTEINTEIGTRINRDIESIDQLLIENHRTIEQLRSTISKLKSENAPISGLEKLVSQLTLQVESKDQEIKTLKNTIAGMEARVDVLTGEVADLNMMVGELTSAASSLKGEVVVKTNVINTGYYIIGSEKELISKGIVYKSGFIGRTLKLNENRSLENFTQIDIRKFDQLSIGGRKVNVISAHPQDSYELTFNSDGTYDTLKITDKNRFWEYSKVLVVSYK